MKAPWLHTLASLWGVVHSNGGLVAQRRSLAEPPAAYRSGEAHNGGISSQPVARCAASLTLPSSCPPTVVIPDVVAAIAELRRRAGAASGDARTPISHGELPSAGEEASIPDVATLSPRREGGDDVVEYHVLVTGSLYLVGAALEAVGWSEDAQ